MPQGIKTEAAKSWYGVYGGLSVPPIFRKQKNKVMTINELKEKLNQWEKESPLGGETPICMKWLHRYDYDYDFDDLVRIDYDAPYRKVGISVEE